MSIPEKRVLAVGTAVVIMLTIAGALSFARYARRHAPNPQLIAVAPFDIFVSGLEEWRVRLAEGLTAQLSSAAPLSAVPQTVVRERWSGSDRPEIAALELARRTSAGVAIYGRLDPLAESDDSVRVQAIAIDAASSRVLFGILLRWSKADLGNLSATLAEHVRHNYPARGGRAP
jgi:hypothetical protein